jgi:hypothetical protein
MSLEEFVKANFNFGSELIYSDKQATLSQLVDRCDCLKIDTDGFDLRVLHGAEGMFARSKPLVILMEANMLGDARYGESSLTGITDFLRSYDYTWLDISVERYSRAALPQKFRYSMTASTERGPIGFCDATYVDDPLSRPGKLTEWLANGTMRAKKLLALYDILGFPDCAAELILALSRHPDSADAGDWPALLTVLDPDYHARMTRFREDPMSFT